VSIAVSGLVRCIRWDGLCSLPRLRQFSLHRFFGATTCRRTSHSQRELFGAFSFVFIHIFGFVFYAERWQVFQPFRDDL
jgi:hypothetical protein